jgi:uncharacterized BrkB/YihY/UPF0761 family membrane protein
LGHLLQIGAYRNGPASTLSPFIYLQIISATTAFSELKASPDELWKTPPKALEGWQSLLCSRLLLFGLVLTLAFFLLLSLMLNASLQIARSYYMGFGTDADCQPGRLDIQPVFIRDGGSAVRGPIRISVFKAV